MSSCSLCRFPRKYLECFLPRTLTWKFVLFFYSNLFFVKQIQAHALFLFQEPLLFLHLLVSWSHPLGEVNPVFSWNVIGWETEKGLNEEPHGGKLKVSILHQFPGCSLKSPSVSLTHSFSIDPFSPSKKHYYEKENKTWLVSWLNKLSMINF